MPTHGVCVAGAIGAKPHLHATGLVLDVRERGTAEIAQLHHPAGDRDDRSIRRVDIGIRMLGLVRGEQPARLLDGRGRREVDAVRRDPARTQLVDLAAPLCEEIVGWHAPYLPRHDARRASRCAGRGAS